MTNETRVSLLKNRLDILQARTTKDNQNIVKKIKRQIRNLSEV